jgi:membrane protease YdiL (CAAX protease family)
VSAAGWSFLIVAGVYLPLLAVRTAWRVRKPGGTPRRTQHLLSVFVVHASTLVLAVLAARYEGIQLFPPASPGVFEAALGLAILIPALATLPWRWSQKSAAEKRRMMWLVPNAARDLWWWALVSVSAGFVEELVYRGVMATLLQRISGSWWLAVALAVTSFCIAHYVQGWRSMAAIALISTAMHATVRLTGNLYTAMVVHAVYDMLAGVLIVRLALRDGVVGTLLVLPRVAVRTPTRATTRRAFPRRPPCRCRSGRTPRRRWSSAR